MSDKRNNNHSGGGMALNDIYFVLFRHKWKIIILSSLGFITAAGIYLFKPPTYQSEADLFIKYVKRETPEGPNSTEPQTMQLDAGLEGVMGAEFAILNSFDLAYEVATNIGPSKVLGNIGGPNDPAAANAAANRVRDNLMVDRFPRSSVMKVVFSHPDPTLVQPILQQLIDDYLVRHKEIHGANLSYEELAEEVDVRHKELQQTEEELRKAKASVNVDNVDKMKENYEQALSMTHQNIILVQADLAEHQTKLNRLKADDKTLATTAKTNNAGTNVLAEIPKQKIADYQQAVDLLSKLKNQYIDLRTTYSEHSKPVLDKEEQVADQEKVKKKFEQDEPRLVDYAAPDSKNPGQASAGVIADLTLKTEQAAVESLQQKLKVYQDSYDQFHTESTNLNAQEYIIRELEHKLKSQQSTYDYFNNALQTKRIDVELGAVKDANITVTQKPSPPVREAKKTPKMMGIAAGAGVVLGLAWAFLIELYFDHSVKRAKDVETNLGMRLFLSIPDMRRNGHRRAAKAAFKKAKQARELQEAGPLVPSGNGAPNGGDTLEIAPWDHNHSLHQHYEALRDRLITYFEVNNLNHKPKLVAVTGSSKGSGTSTIAAGLAASLSETGDGNVLLIDMNLEQGAAQQFFKGKPHCELDAALQGDTMHSAMIQDNLYVVAGRTNAGDKLSSMLPKRFANLIPKLKASDYDYIIFDMPPISRTGVTQRLAGFMDMMMLVVEAEKTNRDVVRQANALLTESKAKVSVVLNKTRTYVPARLHQEF